MLSPRMSLGIAQTAFYVPALALAIYLFIRNKQYHPRMAWWPFITLSVFRLAGGILTIVIESRGVQNDNLGLFIAAIILLNVGVIPLIVATLGQMRIVLIDNYSTNPRTTKIALVLRLAFYAAIILLGTGGGLYSVSKTLARALSLAGYGVFAAEVVVLLSMEVYYFTKRRELIPSSRRVLLASLTAAPFLIVRTVYGIFEAVHEFDYTSQWSPLFGNIYIFAFMALLMEYVVMWIYFVLGFSMPPDRGVGEVLPTHRQNHKGSGSSY